MNQPGRFYPLYGPLREAALPSYQTAAEFLEQKNAAGWRLIGWTVLRAVMIGMPFVFLRVDTKKVIIGSLGASTMISLFAVARIRAAAEAAARQEPPLLPPP